MPPVETDILATMRPDGTRRWLRPVVSPGKWWRRRRAVAWGLICIYAITPFLTWGGLPLAQFDIPGRRLVFFGMVLRPTDMILLALLTIMGFLVLFFATAVLGRVWCGWICPQTVYLEFLYRPLERLLLGTGSQRRSWGGVRMTLLAAAYIVVSAHLANTFIAWFVGARPLHEWITHSPAAHPTAFSVFLIITVGMLFLFGYFREQLCSVVCPYGRFQAALLDRRSLIVGYDRRRGEPRGALGRSSGSCVDCKLCVRTCPQGVDIRNGMQMECMQCTQCIDACDRVMTTLHLPTGLIRYGSQESFEPGNGPVKRSRLLVYPALLLILAVVFGIVVANRRPIAVSQIRVQDVPFTSTDAGQVHSVFRLQLENRTAETVLCTLTAVAPARLELNPQVELAPYGAAEIEAVALSAPADFTQGRRSIAIEVSGESLGPFPATVTLLGPLTLPAAQPATAVGGAP